MAMIICNECGREISDKAGNCPHCGCPINLYDSHTEPQNLKPMVNEKPKKKKDSKLSIWAAILALFSYTVWIGGILAIIDLLKKDKEKRHIGSGFAIFMCIMWLFVSCVNTDDTEGIPDTNLEISTETVEEPTVDEEPIAEETAQEESKENVIEKGSSFDKDGLKITLNDCSADFTDYEDEYGWYKPEEGYKYAMASFTYENTGGSGDSDKYASIYDFECYADGSFCEQEYGLGEEFMNANLSPGRNVSFETYYLVPIDCTEIELEYTANYWTNEKVIIKIQ